MLEAVLLTSRSVMLLACLYYRLAAGGHKHHAKYSLLHSHYKHPATMNERLPQKKRVDSGACEEGGVVKPCLCENTSVSLLPSLVESR